MKHLVMDPIPLVNGKVVQEQNGSYWRRYGFPMEIEAALEEAEVMGARRILQRVDNIARHGSPKPNDLLLFPVSAVGTFDRLGAYMQNLRQAADKWIEQSQETQLEIIGCVIHEKPGDEGLLFETPVVLNGYAIIPLEEFVELGGVCNQIGDEPKYEQCHICGTLHSVEENETRDKDCGAATPQPPPKGDGEVVLDMVVADIKARIKDGSISGTEGGVAIAAIHDFEARSEEGSKKYGTRLKTFNGRDALMDAYQEAIDLVMYLRQAIAERAQGNEEQHRCRCHRGSGDPHIS